MEQITIDRAKYEEKLEEHQNKNSTSNRSVWKRQHLEHVKNLLATADSTEKKSSSVYYYLKKYELVKLGSESHVIMKRKNLHDNYVFMVAVEDYFPKLWQAHLQTGHGGRDKVMAYMKKKWKIPRSACEIFVSCCETCNNKKKPSVQRTAVESAVEPIVNIVTNDNFNGRGQVSLIDFQSTPDGEFSWLMCYQDNATKFLQLRPLKSKNAVIVAEELLKIFFTFGPPCSLESDIGKDFIATVIDQLVLIWPQCKINHGSTCPKAERPNTDVKNMLRRWMIENRSTNWSRGCYEVQWMKNTTFNSVMNKSPYEALLGPVVCGLASSSFLHVDVPNNVNLDSDYKSTSNDQSADSQERNSGGQCQLDINAEINHLSEHNDFLCLGEEAPVQSLTGSQADKSCTCKSAAYQCKTNRCACFKAKATCHSGCHQFLDCCNK